VLTVYYSWRHTGVLRLDAATEESERRQVIESIEAEVCTK